MDHADSKPATIIATRPRLEALRTIALGAPVRDACACGLIRLDYAPERKVGAATHGVLVCYREGCPR
jgi:hypothetical protein